MLRRIGVAAFVVLFLGGFVFAETFRGTVKKVEDDSITISYRKTKDDEPEDKKIKTKKDTTYKLRKGFGKDAETEDSDAKKFKTAFDKVEKGSRIFVIIETDDDGNAKSISYGAFGKGKGKGKKKKDD
jgi:hypothetical protein